jgi:adenylate kinase
MQSETFVFFGIAGSGKGTQIKLLTDLLKARDGKDTVYVSPGNEYRRIIQSGTETAALVKVILNRGGLLPDFLTGSVITNILIDNLSLEKHLIVDGYPRTIAQAQFLKDALEFYSRTGVKIIYLELSETEATKRLKLRARHDDTDESIKSRFNDFTKNVIPSMNYFKDKENYKIYTINGEQTVENVQKDIIKALGF